MPNGHDLDADDLSDKDIFLINEALHFEEFEEDVRDSMGDGTYNDLVELQARFDTINIGEAAEE